MYIKLFLKNWNLFIIFKNRKWIFDPISNKMEFGILIHSNGDNFVGNFSNGKADGRGVYTHKDGATYDGEWKDDLQHGAQLVLKLIFIFDFWIL